MSLLMASAKPISGLGPREAKIRFFGPAAYPAHERAEGEDRVTGELAFLREFVSSRARTLLSAATVCNWSSPDRARG